MDGHGCVRMPIALLLFITHVFIQSGMCIDSRPFVYLPGYVTMFINLSLQSVSLLQVLTCSTNFHRQLKLSITTCTKLSSCL